MDEQLLQYLEAKTDGRMFIGHDTVTTIQPGANGQTEEVTSNLYYLSRKTFDPANGNELESTKLTISVDELTNIINGLQAKLNGATQLKADLEEYIK